MNASTFGTITTAADVRFIQSAFEVDSMRSSHDVSLTEGYAGRAMDDHEPRRRFLKTMATGYAGTAFGYGTFGNARNGAMLEFMGSEGTLYLDRGRNEIYPERKRAAAAPSLAYSEWVIGEGPRCADFYIQPNGELLHLSNWIECVRSRKQPNAPVEAAVRAAASAHLANRALRTGLVAKWEGPAI
jgi:hypothetical protein